MSRSRVTLASSTSNSCTYVSSDAATGPNCELFQRDNRLGFDNPNSSATDGTECPSNNIATASCLNSSVNDRRDRVVF